MLLKRTLTFGVSLLVPPIPLYPECRQQQSPSTARRNGMSVSANREGPAEIQSTRWKHCQHQKQGSHILIDNNIHAYASFGTPTIRDR
jgi:hypothetical protein